MKTLPVNAIPYVFAAIATLVVGIRSTQNYRKLHSSLSLHFAISGFLASAGLFLYALPFLLTSNQQILKVCLLVGRAVLDAVAYWQIYLLWYLTYLKKYSLKFFVWPLAVIGVVGYITQVFYIINSNVGLSNNLATYSYSEITIYTHSLSLIIVFFAGLILAKQSSVQTKLRAKIRLLSIAILYLFASAADLYSTLFLNGSNNSWVVFLGFFIAAGVFLLTTLIYSKKSNQT